MFGKSSFILSNLFVFLILILPITQNPCPREKPFSPVLLGPEEKLDPGTSWSFREWENLILQLQIEENNDPSLPTFHEPVAFQSMTFADPFRLAGFCRQKLETDPPDRTGALACYEAGLTGLPTFFPFLHNGGILAYRLHDYKRSILYFRKAIALVPDSWISRMGLARVYRLNKQYAAAIQQLEEAHRTNPFDHRISLDQGELYLEKGQADLALPYFRRAMEISPESWQARSGVVRCLVLNGKKKEAITLLPDQNTGSLDGRAHYYRALLFETTGDLDLAIDELDQLLKLKTDRFFLILERNQIKRLRDLLLRASRRPYLVHPAILPVEPL